MSHTPGEWKVNDELSYDGSRRVLVGDGYTVAVVPRPAWGTFTKDRDAERDDNAALIASAPTLLRQRDELLAAAKQVLAAWFRSNSITVDDVQAVQALRAAVASVEKARTP